VAPQEDVQVCVAVLQARPAVFEVTFARRQSPEPLHPQVPPTQAAPASAPAVQSRQAPLEPHEVAELAVHFPDLQQLPPVHVPLPGAPQSAVHVPLLHVGVAPAHAEHTPPSLPHAALTVPAWHVPFTAAEQHPPLQACCELQDVVHVLVAPSHAMPVGQSALVEHPHTPERHACPVASVVQLAHTPDAPHAAAAVPTAHVPPVADVQHPPLHGRVAEHTVEQVWRARSHA
jgi:hypothetical protein